MKPVLAALAVAALQGQPSISNRPLSKTVDINAVNTLLDQPGPPQLEPVFAKSRLAAYFTEWFGPIGGYYPERADRFSVSGAVVLECAVSAAGRLSGCTTLIETPAGWGFSGAAEKMISNGDLTTKPANGAKGGDHARMLIQFIDHHRW